MQTSTRFDTHNSNRVQITRQTQQYTRSWRRQMFSSGFSFFFFGCCCCYSVFCCFNSCVFYWLSSVAGCLCINRKRLRNIQKYNGETTENGNISREKKQCTKHTCGLFVYLTILEWISCSQECLFLYLLDDHANVYFHFIVLTSCVWHGSLVSLADCTLLLRIELMPEKLILLSQWRFPMIIILVFDESIGLFPFVGVSIILKFTPLFIFVENSLLNKTTGFRCEPIIERNSYSFCSVKYRNVPK